MNGDPGWFLTEVHRHQRDGAAPVPTDTHSDRASQSTMWVTE